MPVSCDTKEAVKLCRGPECVSNEYNITCREFMRSGEKGSELCNGLHFVNSSFQTYWTVNSECPCDTEKKELLPTTCYTYRDFDGLCTLGGSISYDSCPIPAPPPPMPPTCECYPCGSTTVGTWTSGSCKPSSSICSATKTSTSSTCYTNCASDCDCASNKCATSPTPKPTPVSPS